MDYVDLACRSTREEFVAACPFPFLVGFTGIELQRLAKPAVGTVIDTPRFTAVDPTDPEYDTVLASVSSVPASPSDDPIEEKAVEPPVVYAVRKAGRVLPNMITVGRTQSSNDIVIRDPRISKLHAYFELASTGAQLYDVGSSNGTWVGRKKLIPKGPAVAVKFGDVVLFGGLMFTFLEAPAAWSLIRRKVGKVDPP